MPTTALRIHVLVRPAYRAAIKYLYEVNSRPGWPWLRVATTFPDFPGIRAWSQLPGSAFIPMGSTRGVPAAFLPDHTGFTSLTGEWIFACTAAPDAARTFAETVLQPISLRIIQCQALPEFRQPAWEARIIDLLLPGGCRRNTKE